MPKLSCSHPKEQQIQKVCPHIFENDEINYIRYFIGIGLQYHLLCNSCSTQFNEKNILLESVCETCFKKLEDSSYWCGVAGKPEIKLKPSSLNFTHHETQLNNLLSTNFLDIQPLGTLPNSIWIGLTNDGNILTIDFESQVVSKIVKLSASVFDLTKSTSLQIAPNGRFIALVHTLGVDGVVLDVGTGQVTIQLKRDNYHSDVTPFSIAFCMHNGKALLVHSTAWNRLDISDPSTGKLLTERGPTSYKQGEQRPNHYLDYFHGRLLVSPNQEWIADDGWVWHPIGWINSWNIREYIVK